MPFSYWRSYRRCLNTVTFVLISIDCLRSDQSFCIISIHLVRQRLPCCYFGLPLPRYKYSDDRRRGIEKSTAATSLLEKLFSHQIDGYARDFYMISHRAPRPEPSTGSGHKVNHLPCLTCQLPYSPVSTQ